MSDGRVVVVVGNPKPRSRTLALGELVAERVGALAASTGSPTHVVDLAEVGPSLLGWGDPTVQELKASVTAARAVVVVSPTYKATYTGLLKLFLDQFDAGELGGVPAVAVMTGGDRGHSLAVDVHLVPVLTEIGASCPTRGLFVAGPEIDDPSEAVDRWLTTWNRPLTAALTGTPIPPT